MHGGLPEGEHVEGVLQFEYAGEGGFELVEVPIGEPFLRQGLPVYVRSVFEGARTDDVTDDGLDLVEVIAETAESRGDRLVDDLEVTATGQLLELDQGEVGLDARGVAVHEEPDGPRWCQHGRLSVAITMCLAPLQGQIPGLLGCLDQFGRTGVGVDTDHLGGDALEVVAVVGGHPVVANHPQHRIAVFIEARERPGDLRDLR